VKGQLETGFKRVTKDVILIESELAHLSPFSRADEQEKKTLIDRK
jgi:hypothetical protein